MALFAIDVDTAKRRSYFAYLQLTLDQQWAGCGSCFRLRIFFHELIDCGVSHLLIAAIRVSVSAGKHAVRLDRFRVSRVTKRFEDFNFGSHLKSHSAHCGSELKRKVRVGELRCKQFC